MNLINALPGIVPTARPYTMGEWPQHRMKMRNKRTARWGLANMSTGEKLSLEWGNITYAQAEQLVRIWDLNYGMYGKVELPPEVFAGTEIPVQDPSSSALRDLMASPFAGTVWVFTEPPRVSPVKAGRCTVRMPIGARGFAEQEP